MRLASLRAASEQQAAPIDIDLSSLEVDSQLSVRLSTGKTLPLRVVEIVTIPFVPKKALDLVPNRTPEELHKLIASGVLTLLDRNSHTLRQWWRQVKSQNPLANVFDALYEQLITTRPSIRFPKETGMRLVIQFRLPVPNADYSEHKLFRWESAPIERIIPVASTPASSSSLTTWEQDRQAGLDEARRKLYFE